jgi:hypothetical protein
MITPMADTGRTIPCVPRAGGDPDALIALICFVIALLDVTLGGLDLVTLGLAFLAAHLAFDLPLSVGRWRKRRR